MSDQYEVPVCIYINGKIPVSFLSILSFLVTNYILQVKQIDFAYTGAFAAQKLNYKNVSCSLQEVSQQDCQMSKYNIHL
jgi:hypothetical protein